MAPSSTAGALADPPVAPKPRQSPRRHRTRRQRIVLGVGIALVLAILAALGTVGYGWWRFNQINKEKLSLSKAGSGEPLNILIVGSDSRDVVDKSDPNYKAFKGGSEPTGGQRSDTIMVVRVDPKAHTVDMVSFPRDLWVPIATTGESQRINTAYSLPDGHQALIDTIQQDFGIPINHYIDVNFASFQDVVKAIGGLSMYFDKPMRDTNSGLNVKDAGCVKLDGENALAFARSRHLQYYEKGRWHDDPTADLGRISRQQYFIRKLMDKTASQVTSLDIKGTNDLLQAGVKNLTVDSTFTPTAMLSLARDFKSFTGDQMVTHTLPTTPWTTAGGAAVLRLDQSGSEPIFELFKGQSASQLNPSDVTLSVGNGGGVSGVGAKAQAGLQSLGFVVSGADTVAVTSRTKVRFAPGSQDHANLVARHTKGGAEVTEDASLAAGQVKLVIGKDFAGIVDDAGTVVGGAATGTSGKGTTSTTAPATTTTSVIGIVPGQPPDGVSCG
jgi:LCP family protein required for cell wall assembly